MSRVRSIRRFLLSGILALVSVSLAVSGLIGYLEANHEMEELFDARLAQSARITNQLLDRYLKQRGDLPSNGAIYQEWEQAVPNAPHQEPSGFGQIGQDNEFTPYGHEFERNLTFQLTDGEGNILLRSPSAPRQLFGKPELGFGAVHRDGHDWRTFTLYNEDEQTWLIVAERDDERGELASKMATLTMLPLFITLPFLLGLLWWLVTRGLAPLHLLAQAIGERHPANLSPLNLAIKAEELTPLVGEINRLMHTLADTLEREKQFTNEAAHELRTPLAVLRIHSENAMAAEDEQSREQALRKMQLALEPLLQSTLATLAPIALKKDQQLSLEGAGHLQVMGQAMLLELMFGNLIDNALRYTQVGGEVAVVVSQVGNRIRVDVRDNGPGIPTAALSRLCERFFRVNPQQGDGVGLGMAIVQRIAQLHGADLDIHNRPEGGLEVSVLLPSPLRPA